MFIEIIFFSFDDLLNDKQQKSIVYLNCGDKGGIFQNVKFFCCLEVSSVGVEKFEWFLVQEIEYNIFYIIVEMLVFYMGDDESCNCKVIKNISGVLMQVVWVFKVNKYLGVFNFIIVVL